MTMLAVLLQLSPGRRNAGLGRMCQRSEVDGDGELGQWDTPSFKVWMGDGTITQPTASSQSQACCPCQCTPRPTTTYLEPAASIRFAAPTPFFSAGPSCA